MKYIFLILMGFIGKMSLGQKFIIKPSLSFGTESNKINFKTNSDIKWKNNNVYNTSTEISSKNSKVALIEIKYCSPKLAFGAIQFYPLVVSGTSSDKFKFDRSSLPFIYYFSEASLLNGLLIGGSFHSEMKKNITLFFEAGLVHKHYLSSPLDIKASRSIKNEGLAEVRVVSSTKDNIGVIVKTGLDLKLKKNNSISFGVSLITSKTHHVYYSYEWLFEGGSSGGSNNYSIEKYLENYKFLYLNIGYQFILNSKRHHE